MEQILTDVFNDNPHLRTATLSISTDQTRSSPKKVKSIRPVNYGQRNKASFRSRKIMKNTALFDSNGSEEIYSTDHPAIVVREDEMPTNDMGLNPLSVHHIYNYGDDYVSAKIVSDDVIDCKTLYRVRWYVYSAKDDNPGPYRHFSSHFIAAYWNS